MVLFKLVSKASLCKNLVSQHMQFSHLLTSEKICRSVPEDVLSSLLVCEFDVVSMSNFVMSTQAIISRRRDAVLLNHCCRCVRRLILSDSRKEILLKFDVIKTFVSLMTCEGERFTTLSHCI